MSEIHIGNPERKDSIEKLFNYFLKFQNNPQIVMLYSF